MLAIVCESSSYASCLVEYGPDGQINAACGLHAIAAKLGLTLDRQFVLICLENIRYWCHFHFCYWTRLVI